MSHNCCPKTVRDDMILSNQSGHTPFQTLPCRLHGPRGPGSAPSLATAHTPRTAPACSPRGMLIPEATRAYQSECILYKHKHITFPRFSCWVWHVFLKYFCTFLLCFFERSSDHQVPCLIRVSKYSLEHKNILFLQRRYSQKISAIDAYLKFVNYCSCFANGMVACSPIPNTSVEKTNNIIIL